MGLVGWVRMGAKGIILSWGSGQEGGPGNPAPVIYTYLQGSEDPVDQGSGRMLALWRFRGSSPQRAFPTLSLGLPPLAAEALEGA